jgi:hypothetical protein
MAAQILRQTVQFLHTTVLRASVDQENIGGLRFQISFAVKINRRDRRNVGKIDMADHPKPLHPEIS